MTSWDERALEEAKNEHARNRLYDLEKSRLTTFVEGARLQREALLSDEAVERAARAINQGPWLFRDEYVESGRPVDCGTDLAVDESLRRARAALLAAIGDDDE